MSEAPGLGQIRHDALARVERALAPHARYLSWSYGPVEPYYSFYGGPDGLPGLVVTATGVRGQAQVVVVAVQRLLPLGGGGLSSDRRTWTRDADFDYSLSRGYETLLFELSVVEDPWSGRGHSRSWPVLMRRSDDPGEIAASILEWSRYPETHATPARPEATGPDLGALRAIAEAKRGDTDASTVEGGLDEGVLRDLEAPSRERLEADLRALSERAVFWHFPRDARGQLELDTVALLARYDTRAVLPQGRRIWLALRGPRRRRDPQVLTLHVESLIAENHSLRWDEAPWQWDQRHIHTPLPDRWGLIDREDEARAAQCSVLLDRGEVPAALALYGVDLHEDVDALLHGKPVQYDVREPTEVWARRVLDGLASSAPWLLPRAGDRSPTVRQVWGGARPGRSSRPLRLFELGVIGQQRRPGIFLVRAPASVQLTLDFSASNARVPTHAWQRPVDYDLLRLSLINPSDIPGVSPP